MVAYFFGISIEEQPVTSMQSAEVQWDAQIFTWEIINFTFEQISIPDTFSIFSSFLFGMTTSLFRKLFHSSFNKTSKLLLRYLEMKMTRPLQ